MKLATLGLALLVLGLNYFNLWEKLAVAWAKKVRDAAIEADEVPSWMGEPRGR